MGLTPNKFTLSCRSYCIHVLVGLFVTVKSVSCLSQGSRLLLSLLFTRFATPAISEMRFCVLARDAFIQRIVALLPRCSSVCPFVCLSVRLSGRACFVIIHYNLAQISVDGWIVQCSGHPYTKACPPISNRLSTSIWKTGGVWMCKLHLEVALNTNIDK